GTGASSMTARDNIRWIILYRWLVTPRRTSSMIGGQMAMSSSGTSLEISTRPCSAMTQTLVSTSTTPARLLLRSSFFVGRDPLLFRVVDATRARPNLLLVAGVEHAAVFRGLFKLPQRLSEAVSPAEVLERCRDRSRVSPLACRSTDLLHQILIQHNIHALHTHNVHRVDREVKRA